MLAVRAKDPLFFIFLFVSFARLSLLTVLMNTRVTRETIYGHVIYPDKLPRARGSMAGSAALTMSVFALACVPALAPGSVFDTYSRVFILVLGYVGVRVIIVFLTRLTYYAEERRHLPSRYQSDESYLVKKLMEFSTAFKYNFVLLVLLSFLIMLLFVDVNCIIRDHASPPTLFIVFLIGNFIMQYVELERNSVLDSILLESFVPLDYGSGMALNFFYGYLHLCLPNTGDSEKGLLERIDDYIGKHGLDDNTFPLKKLVILIPSSSYVPNDLKEKSYGWMENAGSLEKQVKDRAGVKSRVYKNSVYRIQNPDSDDRPVYVVAEGATPCKTLHEVIQYSGSRQSFFREHHKEIIFMFYERLREVIRGHPECKDLCELIYYVDRDENGLDNVNVAKIILQRIGEIKEAEVQLQQLREAEGL